MQALYLSDGRLHYRSAHPQPRPNSDEALIRVTLAGICATDLELVKGYAGGLKGIPGHEFVGVIEATPESKWLGRRVVGSINLAAVNA